jgi:hypothetical protein
MNLTNEQITLIPTYWHKWQRIASNRSPIDRSQTIEAINFLYKQANLDRPEVIFVANPHPYYAQAFLGSMPDDLRSTLDLILRNDPNHLFFDDAGENIAQLLSQQLLAPIECLNGEYLRKTLTKINQGKSLVEARREADEEVYTQASKITLRSISQIDGQFHRQFQASNRNHILCIENNRSWMGDIYDLLYLSLNIPKALIAELIDRGYHDFRGISVGCLDRVILAFACARFDCFREILALDVGANEEVIQSLLKSGGRIFFPYRKICLVCETLNILAFYNNKGRISSINVLQSE